MPDPHNLARFVAAQAGSYETALAELRAGQKRSHWIWYIFPQLRGLGQSALAHEYGIASLDEARAYLAHPMLGPRYDDCLTALAPHSAATIARVMGSLDAIKLRSSLTLFAPAGSASAAAALTRLFDGEQDPKTLALLNGG